MADQAIELFAALMARLDEPFADRAQVLHAAGLDDGDFQRMIDRWSKELRGEGAEALAPRYGDAYAAAARELTSANQGERAAPDLRFLNADAQSFRDEAAAVPLQASAETTPASPTPALVHTPPLATPPPIAPPPLVSPPLVSPRIVGASEPALERSSRVPEGMRGFKDLHRTQGATDAPRGPALPFESSHPAAPSPAPAPITPSKPPPLSLEQYVSICVDLAARPTRREVILGRYRMTDEQHRRADAYWQERMAADPMVWMAWDRACVTYRAWLAQSQTKKP